MAVLILKPAGGKGDAELFTTTGKLKNAYAFVEAGVHQHSRAMHDDLIDGVRWAIAKGIADPRRVAIMGASYGGYATLVGLTFTPEVFACGVDLFGPSNLVSLLEARPAYWTWSFFQPYYRKYYGEVTQPDDRRRLESQSPLFRADRVQRPLLVIHGANDPNVRKQKYLDSGQRYLEKGKYREASIQFSNAIQVDARYADAHYQLAQAYLKLQDWPRAYQELVRTVELQPENYKAHIDLANLLTAGRDLKQAQEQTDLLLEKNPNDPQIVLEELTEEERVALLQQEPICSPHAQISRPQSRKFKKPSLSHPTGQTHTRIWPCCR